MNRFPSLMPALYRVATGVGAPVIDVYLRYRLAVGREDPARFPERLGKASRARPKGFLVWFHAASVGESVSILSLIDAIRARYPQHTILVTSGTVTSARLLTSRLPPNVLHQFVPVDRAVYVNSFLDHWKPDLALWVESELWPNMLAGIKARSIPAVLLNARMSERSFRAWHFFKAFARTLLETFPLILAQSAQDAEKFARLAAPSVRVTGNLKYASAPPPCDAIELAKLRESVGARHAWLMASTHPGEEEIALAVHHALEADFPDLLTIIAPRHPARGAEIVAMLEKEWPARASSSSFKAVARRADNDPLTAATKIYVADTMGELGIFFRLCSITCVAGSFTWGGHNPIEPAQTGSAIVFGPLMTNFLDIAQDFVQSQGAIQVRDADGLAQALAHLFRDAPARAALIESARGVAAAQESVLSETLSLLEPFLSRQPREAA